MSITLEKIIHEKIFCFPDGPPVLLDCLAWLNKVTVSIFPISRTTGKMDCTWHGAQMVLKWTALHRDQSLLQPVLSPRFPHGDPCIIRGEDGLFHMVWTVSWNQRGIGYAHSKDLIHWSEQQYIPVMHVRTRT